MRFASRFPAPRAAGFYRDAQNFLVSSIGIGTYLGSPDSATDQAYSAAITAAVRGGINVIDSAINYRHQRSERSIASALSELREAGHAARDELVICTKAGFLVPNAIPADSLRDEDVVGGMHCMAPAFLADQIDRSRANLGIETIDVFYLHNPETQLGFVSQDVFYDRVKMAFTLLEELVERGRISYYGAATWEGYRKQPGAADGLSLARMVQAAREAGGDEHHFRFIQLPFNLAMPEAFIRRPETVAGEPLSVLEAAAFYGLTVIASASLLQARLARNLSEEIVQRISGAATDAQRAIQFTRSTPGITTALVGMSSGHHVSENIDLAALSPIPPDAYMALYSRDKR